MAEKFTPGPWEAEKAEKHFRITGNLPKTGCFLIGEICNSHIKESSYGAMEEANARLVAAAPDLYEALKLWFDSKATSEELVKKARAALALVERSEEPSPLS